MKKYLYLLIGTLAILGVILMSGAIVNQPVEAEVYTVREETAENTITAVGKLQYGASKSVTVTQHCFIESILVKNGDQVAKGDTLMVVYEAPDSADLKFYLGDVKNISSLLSKMELSEEIKEEIKKYGVKKMIKAPQNGTVTGLSVEDSSIVLKDTEVLKISDKSSMMIPVNINEANIEKIEPGQTAAIRFTAISDRTYTGKVTKISSEAKQTSTITGKETSVEVMIKLDDPDELLRIGYSAECTITTSIDENIIIIPYEYIHSDEKGDYIFTVKNNRALKKYLKIGNEYKNGVQIQAGAEINDLVIKNTENIYGGCRVSVKNG